MSRSIDRLKRKLEFLQELERSGELECWEDIQEHLANLLREAAEAKRLHAECEKLDEVGRQQAGDEWRPKPGAKRKWKGNVGYCLICAVRALTADGNTSQAQAFRDLHSWAKNWHRPLSVMDANRRERFAQLVGEHWDYIRDECRRDPRELAARHCEALKAWGPFLEREDALEAEMERWRALSAANQDRTEELLRKSPQK
jgi:hypothetical protein